MNLRDHLPSFQKYGDENGRFSILVYVRETDKCTVFTGFEIDVIMGGI